MPTYAYKCKACKREFEKVQKFADDPLVKCPYCKKMKLVRLISSSGLVFKGSGFYLTDYKKRSTTESEGAPAASSEKSESPKPEKTEKTEKTSEEKRDMKSDSAKEKKEAEKPTVKKKK